MQRIESAIKTNGVLHATHQDCGEPLHRRILKSGPAFDLPIAIGVLSASGQVDEPERLNDYVMMGELSLMVLCSQS